MNFLACDVTKNGVKDDAPTDGPSCEDALGEQACRTRNRRDYMIFVWRHIDSLRLGNITAHTVHLVQTDSSTTKPMKQGHMSDFQVRILLTQLR
jgi:hypothetical protein